MPHRIPRKVADKVTKNLILRIVFIILGFVVLLGYLLLVNC